jgi:hypothetical protein
MNARTWFRSTWLVALLGGASGCAFNVHFAPNSCLHVTGSSFRVHNSRDVSLGTVNARTYYVGDHPLTDDEAERVLLADPRTHSDEKTALALRNAAPWVEGAGGALIGTFPAFVTPNAQSGNWNNAGTFIGASIVAAGLITTVVSFIMSSESSRLAQRSRTTYNAIAAETGQCPIRFEASPNTNEVPAVRL